MYCSSCGIRNDSQNRTCTHCGVVLSPAGSGGHPDRIISDTPSTAANLVSCLVPLAGVIFYLVWREEAPNRARSVCGWTLFGIFGLPVLWVLAMVLGFLSFGFQG